jgi:hypothetical protein
MGICSYFAYVTRDSKHWTELVAFCGSYWSQAETEAPVGIQFRYAHYVVVINRCTLYIWSGNREVFSVIQVSVWPPLWSSGQSSWLQIQRPGFNSWHYQIFWVVGLERGPLSLTSTIEELLKRKSSSSGLENEIMAVGDPPRWQAAVAQLV